MIEAQSFNRAMTLWFELTGLDPNAKSMKFSQWEWSRASDRLKESMELDPSLLTTYFLLDSYSRDYFDQAKISVTDFDEDPQKVFDYMTKVKEFKERISEPNIMEARAEFTDRLRSAMLSYGCDAAAIEALIEKRGAVGILRRDALLSANHLRADHFLQGSPDPADTRPLYHKKLYSYWNINSMVEHLCSMPSGISLNLIRDPDELFSFFSIGIRNGGNVIILTDVPEYAHPLGRDMSRRPDREFSERVGKNWFPYDLLNIKYDEKGDPYHDKYRESTEKGLVPHQPGFVELTDIKDLAPAEVAWFTMMLDLIVEKYWHKPIPTKELSYTGEMLKPASEQRMLTKAAQSNLEIVPYEPLGLDVLTVADVKTGMLDELAIGKRSGNFGSKQWMEDRYGDQVPAAVLNVIGSPKDHEPVLVITDQTSKDATLPVQAGEVTYRKQERFPSFQNSREKALTVGLKQFEPTVFDTREQLDADRKFIARYNYAKTINALAEKEFYERKTEIEQWYREKVKANLHNLLPYAAEDRTYTESESSMGFDREKMAKQQTVLTGVEDLTSKDRYGFGSSVWTQVAIHNGYAGGRSKFLCAVNETQASWRLILFPSNKHEIAKFAGVSVDELPDVLHHWTTARPYIGNSILSRIDPLEWAAHNPWKDMSFTVGIYLSKRARTAIIKDHGAKK